MKTKPDLHFAPSGTTEGFTSAGLTGYRDLNPTTIVRELIQNSLDAVRETGTKKATVRFEVEHSNLSEMPAIEAYRTAFDAAVETQTTLCEGTLPDQAQGVADTVSECLKKSTIETLFVTDNGVGLDMKRMNGLLADGLSVKSSAGAGAVGNGHLTVVPASDMRLVFYGGLNDGKKIASGHTILATFLKDNKLMGKDGHFITGTNPGVKNRYVFPEDNSIPDFIGTRLQKIEEEWETGTVVAVPGFNRFREPDEKLWPLFSRAAVCNFFAAIVQGDLTVEYFDYEKDVLEELKSDNLEEILAKFKSEKRVKKFLPGSKAYEAYQTMKYGQEHVIPTEIGDLTIKLRKLDQGSRSRIDLCRNGMWICDKLPRLPTTNFADYQPFGCLILLNAADGEIHRLVRKSEGPLHNDLEGIKSLKPDERRALNQAFTNISEFLTDNLEKLPEEKLQISDVFTIATQGVSSGGSRSGLVGELDKVRPRLGRGTSGSENETGQENGGNDPDKGSGGGGGKGRSGRGEFKKSGKGIQFGAIAVPTGLRSYQIEIIPGEEVPQSEIRFALDEGLDETCDSMNGEGFVRLEKVTLDGAKVLRKNLVSKGGCVLGVRLGQLDPNKRRQLAFDFKLPDNIHATEDTPVVLKIQLVRRASVREEAHG